MTSSTQNTVNEADSKVVRDAMRPFDGTLKRLEVHGDFPGYRLQWANDVGNRIAVLKRFGWDFVLSNEVDLNDRVLDGNNSVDDKVKRAVGGRADRPTYAYLMKLPEERWQEMQAFLMQGPDAFDAAIRRGFGSAQQALQQGQEKYTPPWAKQDMDTSAFTGAAVAGPMNPANPGGQQRVRPSSMGLGATKK